MLEKLIKKTIVTGLSALILGFGGCGSYPLNGGVIPPDASVEYDEGNTEDGGSNYMDGGITPDGGHVECLDGQIERIECETNGPCKGYQKRECFREKWFLEDDCDLLNISKLAGGDNWDARPSLYKNNIAFLHMEDWDIWIYNLSEEVVTKKISLSSTFPNLNMFGWFKLNNNDLLARVGSSEGSDHTLNIDIITNQIVEIPLSNGGGCFDIEEHKIVCVDREGIFAYDLLNRNRTQIFQGGSSYPLPSISNNHVVFEKHDGNSDSIIYVFDITTERLHLISNGHEPLIFNNQILFQNIERDQLLLYNLETESLENLTQETGFNCSTNKLRSSFYGNNLICEPNGVPGLYVLNVKSKNFMKINEPVRTHLGEPHIFENNGSSIFDNKIVFEYTVIINGNGWFEGIHLCELKDEWMR